MRHFQRITFNLTPAMKRYETLNGKQYLVLPTIMMTEGVHAGSNGPVLYQADELQKMSGPTANHRPVSVYHPTTNGTATDSDVLERQGVGITMRSEYDGRSKTEVWADEARLRQLAPKVYDAIQNNQSVEVSTGLYHDLEDKAGEWNGQAYKGIVRNMVLDHLAILPDQQGACSIAKGAGLLRNAMHELSHQDVMDHLHTQLNGHKDHYESTLPYDQRARIDDVFPKHVVYSKGGKLFKHGYKVKSGKAETQGDPEEVHRQTSYITANKSGEVLVRNDDTTGPITVINKPKLSEMSEEMRRQQFQKTLSEKYADAQQNGEWGGWVQQIFPSNVIWSKDGKLFRLPYTYDNDKIKLSEDTEEVERVEGKVDEYRRKEPIDGTQSPYSLNFSLEQPTMSKPTDAQVQAAAQKSYGFLVNVLKVKPEDAKTMVQNAIHQGAHQMIHDATQGIADAHQPVGDSKSDGQTRTAAGGARADAVNKLIGAGKYREEDRQFLSNLPDDGFERIQKNAVAGATQAIVPYTYTGIGDRSNVHTATTGTQNAAPSLDQWLAGAPAEAQHLLRNALDTYAEKKQGLVKLILNARGNRFTQDQLLSMDPKQLEGIAALVSPNGAPTNNAQGSPSWEQQLLASYRGQGDTTAFDLTTNQQQLTNAELATVLPLPSTVWGDEQKTA